LKEDSELLIMGPAAERASASFGSTFRAFARSVLPAQSESRRSSPSVRDVSERPRRRGSLWVAKGAVAMAILAALSLAVTVLFAQRALDNAADVFIRGDGENLVASLVVELWEVEPPLTGDKVRTVLQRHEAQGLRYVAVINRSDYRVIAEAGAAAFPLPFGLPGDVLCKGRRARLVALVPPPWETRAVVSPRGPWYPVANPRPLIAVEYEPPVLARLQGDLRGISVVAAVAALVLIAFAFAWSRTTERLAVVEEQGERERRLIALGRATWVIAHELRNPLAALKGHAQLLVEDLLDPSRAKAARVVEGAERLERLTSVLLDFVRDAPLNVRVITPAELVDRALAEVPMDHVVVDFSEAPPTLHADLERTSLALRNLVRNAFQATPAGGAPVEIRIVGKEGREVVIEVRDHGPGLAPGAEAHIFDPFVTTKTRGTGLGLSIARRIAEQHFGTLTAETHAVGGAVFRLTLPRDSRLALSS
jgi:two-component system sensor histidine kinase HydH